MELTFRSDVMSDAVCCLDKCSLADLQSSVNSELALEL